MNSSTTALAEALLRGLNPQQRAAAAHTTGALLVLAGAGTGKTRVITHRIAHLLATGHATPEQILAVTFTNKASNEMRERVAKLVGEAAAKQLTIATFHAFCVRVLREHAEELGYRKNFTIASESDVRQILRRVCDDLATRAEGYSPDTFLTAISTAKNGDTGIEQAVEQTPGNANGKYTTHAADVFARYDSALRAANSMDFDDLLLQTLRLWRERPQVLARYQERYRFVLVDEYQDTNRVQYQLLRTLVKAHGNICVVGDDDQAIYGWRGADARNLTDFDRDFPGAAVIALEQNYRSTPRILDAANAVISRNTQRRPKQLWAEREPGRKLDLFVTADEEDEVRRALEWLQHIQAKADAKPHEFAILYRSNQQSRGFELALRQAGIPYAVYGGQDFFERAEVRDVVGYLRVIANPRDETALLRIINVPRRGIGDTTLHKLHDLCRERKLGFVSALGTALREGLLPERSAEALQQFSGLLREFRARFAAKDAPLSIMTHDLLEAIGYRDEVFARARNREQGEQRWENVQAVLESLHVYEQDSATPTLADFLDRSALGGDNDRFARQQRRNEGVSLLTIHAAKGLEFPFVFIVGCEDGLLPHARGVAEGSLEEERRLFYVALTRGMRHVTLFYALSRARGGKARPASPSRFLAEIPEEMLNRQVYAAPEMMSQGDPDALPKDEGRVRAHNIGQTAATKGKGRSARKPGAGPKAKAASKPRRIKPAK